MIGHRFIGLHKRALSRTERDRKISAREMYFLGFVALLAIAAVATMVWL
jgi:uncharacterized membrane protein